jgi:hypothetical protein
LQRRRDQRAWQFGRRLRIEKEAVVFASRTEDGLTVVPYKDALSAFRRDCDEMHLIVEVLKEKFDSVLLGPILDVGAGSGEVAALAFPRVTATLLDQEPYQQSANSNHTRITRNFSALDFGSLKPKTILFCHSANYFLRHDPETTGERLARSGAETVLVVSNEPEGILKEIADQLRSSGVKMPEAFHIAIPELNLEKSERFVARLTTADFETMATHLVRIIFDLEDIRVESLAEELLRSRLDLPDICITEAIYSYRPP